MNIIIHECVLCLLLIGGSITGSIGGGFGFWEQRLRFGSGSELLSITDVERKPLVLPLTVSIFIESTTLRV